MAVPSIFLLCLSDPKSWGLGKALHVCNKTTSWYLHLLVKSQMFRKHKTKHWHFHISLQPHQRIHIVMSQHDFHGFLSAGKFYQDKGSLSKINIQLSPLSGILYLQNHQWRYIWSLGIVPLCERAQAHHKITHVHPHILSLELLFVLYWLLIIVVLLTFRITDAFHFQEYNHFLSKDPSTFRLCSTSK